MQSKLVSTMTPPSVNTRSVRFRTTVGAALVLFGLLALVGVGVNWFVGRQVQQSFDQTLLEQAIDRAALIDEGASIDSLITPVGYEEVVAAIDVDGTVLASSGLAVPTTLGSLPAGVSNFDFVIVESGGEVEEETLRVAVAEAVSGIRIVVANGGESARDTRAAVRNMLFGVIPLTALAGAAVVWRVTGRALKPVKTMRNELNAVVGARDGRRVTEPGTGDEIDELGSTINGVLDRLDEQSLVQRRFVADASHELKSPLANARVIIDTAAKVPDDNEYERVTSAVGSELQRLQALVEDLLYLAQGDEGAPRALQTIDLADVVFDESERVAATSRKRIDASRVVPASVTVEPSEAARAVRNLLENAERFAVERVSVSVQQTAVAVTVIIADDGPGIAVEDRATVFERFGRIDTDRARSAGGTGLGLSIVASIAERNGGAVVLTESPTGGAQFELSFPV